MKVREHLRDFSAGDSGFVMMADVVNQIVGPRPESVKDAIPVGNQTNIDLAQRVFENRLVGLGISGSMAAEAIDQGLARVRKLQSVAESPIERVMAPWLIFDHYGPDFMTVPPTIHIPKEEGAFPGGDICIIPQFAFAKFRLDFAIVATTLCARCIVGLECDGAEFHPNAFDDAKRDNYLLTWGIPVVRAKGKDIYATPRRVMSDVMEAIQWALDSKRGPFTLGARDVSVP